jgi:hypothetical protein
MRRSLSQLSDSYFKRAPVRVRPIKLKEGGHAVDHTGCVCAVVSSIVIWVRPPNVAVNKAAIASAKCSGDRSRLFGESPWRPQLLYLIGLTLLLAVAMPLRVLADGGNLSTTVVCFGRKARVRLGPAEAPQPILRSLRRVRPTREIPHRGP